MKACFIKKVFSFMVGGLTLLSHLTVCFMTQYGPREGCLGRRIQLAKHKIMALLTCSKPRKSQCLINPEINWWTTKLSTFVPLHMYQHKTVAINYYSWESVCKYKTENIKLHNLFFYSSFSQCNIIIHLVKLSLNAETTEIFLFKIKYTFYN